ncbi:Crp/Fnr family transcriptional regulator [Paenibacillus alginolyticus]|uniref:Cyclic nucleotide-binding domain-containing protein n=2 Tax=Paenibacillus alginolyticus TaxID=59839 RepID=A0ABT4G7X8_9BACL|nr:cyclic nucleotide-binding domain-containing protein [Paenibacillus alginolyticus]MCY9692297.1 cyclic nucleotide-binding domain-containing protein [Paenibacillus alginolyticus]
MMKLLSRRLRSELERGQAADKPELEQRHAEVAATLQLPETRPTEGWTKDEVILRRVLVLQKIDLFVHLAPEDFIWLAQRVEEVAYEPGEVICRAGDFGDTMYGIIEGSIRVHRGSEEYAVLQEGAFFGEMAIIDSGPRSADCTAKEAAVLLQLHRDQVLTFCFQNIDVLRSMMRVIADRLRGMV